MKNLSFFTTKPHRAGKGKYLSRISTVIRGYQIADYLGAKLDPKDGYQNDICVYVKPHVHPGDDYPFSGIPYLDVIDSLWSKYILRIRPEVTAILCSKVDYERYSRWVSNKTILIPQHHCNFERDIKKRNGISTAGIIGAPQALEWLPPEILEGLKKRGIDFVLYTSDEKRQGVCDFYKSIDIQIVWRPEFPMGNPLKIVNSMSFGVPTIARDEIYFREVNGCYIPVETPEDFFTQLDNLIESPDLYAEYSEKGIERAENYHIDNISQLYLELV